MIMNYNGHSYGGDCDSNINNNQWITTNQQYI